MNTPIFLDPAWHFADPSLTEDAWGISGERVRVIQDAFIQYMEAGLDLDQICSHLKFNDAELEDIADKQSTLWADLLSTTKAFCAVAMCRPHPRLGELVDYIAQIGAERREDIGDELGRLFAYNPYRKYRVFESLDNFALDKLTIFSPLTVKDTTLIYLINDKEQVNRLCNFFSEDQRKAASQNIKPFPERVHGWVQNAPAYLAHREVITMLGLQARAITDVGHDDSRLFDRQKWVASPAPDFSSPWDLNSLRTDDQDHGLFDRPETLRTIAKYPAECASAVASMLGAASRMPPHQGLLKKIAHTFLDAGLKGHVVFNLLCRDMSLVDIDDLEAAGSIDQEAYIREALNYFNGAWPEARRIIAGALIAREPLERIQSACFSDRLKAIAYSVIPDQALLTQMNPEGRDKAFSSDLGL